MVGLLSKPETWHEILALKEHSDRKDALAAQREKEDGKLSESPKDGGFCCLIPSLYTPYILPPPFPPHYLSTSLQHVHIL